MTFDGEITVQEARRREARSRANGYDGGAGRIQPFEVKNAADIILDLDTPYLIKGIAHPREISFWYGPSTCGKTFFLQYVFWHVALELPVLGRRVHGGSVLYLSMEPGRLDWRLWAARTAYGATDQFIYSESLLNLFDGSSAVEQIVYAIEQHNARAVIIDPLGAAMGGANENDFVDVSVVISKLRSIATRTGVHVACVAHTGKDADRGLRGSSHFYASGDLVVSVSEDLGGERVAEIMKARDAKKGEQVRFRLNEFPLGTDGDGDEPKTLTVEVIEQTTAQRAKAPKISKGDAQALAWLREAINDHGEKPPFELPAGIFVTTKDKWSAIAKKRTGESEGDAIRKAISRAVTNLSVAKMIGVNAPYFWVTK